MDVHASPNLVWSLWRMLPRLGRYFTKKNFDWLAMKPIPTKELGLLLAATLQLLRQLQPLAVAQLLLNALSLLSNRFSNQQLHLLPPPPS